MLFLFYIRQLPFCSFNFFVYFVNSFILFLNFHLQFNNLFLYSIKLTWNLNLTFTKQKSKCPLHFHLIYVSTLSKDALLNLEAVQLLTPISLAKRKILEEDQDMISIPKLFKESLGKISSTKTRLKKMTF